MVAKKKIFVTFATKKVSFKGWCIKRLQGDKAKKKRISNLFLVNVLCRMYSRTPI